MKKKILVVDYEPKALDRLISLIPKDMYEISTAKDGLQAMEEFEKFDPDLVLLRTMLPKKHGFQVCQEMVEKKKNIPVIMHCSIYKSRKYKADATKIYGAVDYLEDPIEEKLLLDTLKTYLRKTEEKTKKEIEPPKDVKLPEIEIPIPKETPQEVKNKGGLDIDKALEETLSGLTAPTKKKETTKVEEPITASLPTIEPKPKVVEEKIPEPPAPQIEKKAEKEQVTSEEIFGEVIKTVEEKIAKPTLQDKGTSPKIDISAALGEKEVEEQQPPKIVEPLEPSKAQELKIEEKPKVLKKPKEVLSEIDKKLEETLSGVKIRPSKAPKEIIPQQQVEVPKAEPEKEELKPVTKDKKEETVPKKVVELKKEEEKAKEEGIPFGQYRLLEKVAIGGMAELFKAKQMGLEGFQRIVAVKRILPHLATNSDFVTMFIDEAKLAAQLNHPNIVHIYDLGKTDESYFIAMEYVEGRDLRSIMKESEPLGKTIPLSAAVYIAKKICSALHYAHTAKDSDGKQMKLVHRDVSPQNILISSSGEVKLVDFGIAKAASKASHTQSGALKGKLLYMSPEQAWGKTLDGRSDIFSIGTVLFEMLTSKKLFYGDSEMSILERVREAKLPDFEQYREIIPLQLEKIIRKALEKDPDKRYRDARNLETDLDKFVRNMGITATTYDVVFFLNEIFPNIYTKDKLETLAREKEEAEAEIAQLKKEKEQAELKEKEKIEKQKEVQKKVDTVKVVPPPKEGPKVVEKAQPPKKEIKIPKPLPVETKKEELFSSVQEESREGKKKTFIIGGAIAAVVIIVIGIAMVFSGGKKGTETVQQPEAPPPVSTSSQAETVKAPEPPKEIQPEVPPPPTIAESEADIKKAKDEAVAAIKNLDETIKGVEIEGGLQFAASTMESLKKSKENIDKIFKRAKSVGEFNAVTQAAKQGVENANKAKSEVAQLKAQKEKEQQEAEARKKTEEEKRKAEDLAKSSTSTQEKKVEKGQFVPLHELAESEKPKLIKKIDATYTTLARQNKVEGTFYIQLTITENGSVSEAEVVKGPSNDFGLKEECIKAALKWQFSPAIKNGVPVKTQMTYPIVFKLK